LGEYDALPKGEYSYEYDEWNPKTKKNDKIPAKVGMVDLQWGMPYFAQWRVDFLVRKDTAKNDLRTRQMLIPEGDGKWRFAKLEQGLAHKQNEQVVVRGLPGQYPSWFHNDAAKTGRVSPLEENYAVIVYPYDRGRETPLDAVTFMDLFREIIGKGPCEYILTAQANVDEGLAACPSTYEIESYDKMGQVVKRRAKVEELLNRTYKFLHSCHNRLTQYQQCKQRTQTLLKAYGSKNADKAKQINNKLRSIIERIPEPLKPLAELEAEWKPAFDAYRATLNSDEPAAKATRAELGEKIRQMGGKSEGMLMSGARKYLKQLRTQAGVEGALHPDFLETATQIRAIVTESLKGPIAHEMMNADMR